MDAPTQPFLGTHPNWQNTASSELYTDRTRRSSGKQIAAVSLVCPACSTRWRATYGPDGGLKLQFPQGTLATCPEENCKHVGLIELEN